ncbi:hypothetical protein [Brevibacillus parabrevis]|uniref:hypothetical protein n=1 Tax=Brevibacillus parabrevis TaxID=54914 RepID=UPI001E469E74|nr:hypothetical protein [Brevibacillus parabrevis]
MFKTYTGMGPDKYLMAYRLNRAKESLLANDAPIGEVAKRRETSYESSRIV